MPSVPVYNMQNQTVGEIKLADELFGAEVRMHLLHTAVRWQQARTQAGTHRAKTRAEVEYSTRKLYKQKGTGNARHGSRKTPTMRGGGCAFPPQVRSHAFKMNKKARRGALSVALSIHCSAGTLKIVDSLTYAEPKTKALAGTLKTLELGENVLIIEVNDNRTLKLSARNIPRVGFLPPEGLNVFDVLKYEKLVITTQALHAIEGAVQA